MGVVFENTCTVSGNEMSTGLFQDFMDEYKLKKNKTLWPLFMDGVQVPQG